MSDEPQHEPRHNNRGEIHQLALAVERMSERIASMATVSVEVRDFVRDRLLEFQLDAKTHRDTVAEQLTRLVTRVEFAPVRTLVYGGIGLVAVIVLIGLLMLLIQPRQFLTP